MKTQVFQLANDDQGMSYKENLELAVEVLNLIRQEIADAIQKTDNTREYTPKEDMFGVGYEQMRTDIRTALKEKGLI